MKNPIYAAVLFLSFGLSLDAQAEAVKCRNFSGKYTNQQTTLQINQMGCRLWIVSEAKTGPLPMSSGEISMDSSLRKTTDFPNQKTQGFQFGSLEGHEATIVNIRVAPTGFDSVKRSNLLFSSLGNQKNFVQIIQTDFDPITKALNETQTLMVRVPDSIK